MSLLPTTLLLTLLLLGCGEQVIVGREPVQGQLPPDSQQTLDDDRDNQGPDGGDQDEETESDGDDETELENGEPDDDGPDTDDDDEPEPIDN